MLCQNEVIEQALCLLGYDADDSGGQPYTRLWEKAPAALRAVYADLTAAERGAPEVLPDGAYTPLPLSPRGAEALPLGLAAALAQLIGSSEDGERLTAQYAKKRAGLSGFAMRADVLPVTEGG